jgi:hypothetical protein
MIDAVIPMLMLLTAKQANLVACAIVLMITTSLLMTALLQR